MKSKVITGMAFLFIFLASCAGGTRTEVPVTISPTFHTLTPTPEPSLTYTPTPTLTRTPLFYNGMLKVQVNVRSGPGTGFNSLGLLGAGTRIMIDVQSSDGLWYRIPYPKESEGTGWVSAQFVDTASTPIPTVTPLYTPVAGLSGTVTQKVNVRSGPGTSYDTLGMLEANSPIILTGKNEVGTWLQVVFDDGTGGRGWISATYVSADGLADLPVLNAFGTPVTPGSLQPTLGPGSIPTPTIGPAPLDGDSSTNPLANVDFNPSGTMKFIFQGDVSFPTGDPDDWLKITPYALPGSQNATLTFGLICSGNGNLVVEVLDQGTPLPGWEGLVCGVQGWEVNLQGGTSYIIHISPAAGTNLQYIQYWLSVQNGF